MKKFFSLFAVILLSAFLFTFCGDEKETEEVYEEMGEDTEMEMGMDESDLNADEAWVREGEIDLASIDENGDGMVYQDPMDWNVIADEPGVCPECGMDLEEVTLEEARENLVENDYKVKE